ncbi:helix-turn-helix transcriptional regulator [Streptomyces nondiastaticus]|uniref:Helix-turn-helix transcriptional regulator n=1 Tax=Streptomyces nondiastaticus TaxID=3154512 RepID=A0ABW6TRT9_9ACTN
MPDRATPHITAPSSTDSSVDALTTSWYTTEEVAQLLKRDPSTLRRWRTARPPQGPPFVQLSQRAVMYSALDLQQWLASRRIDPAQAA